MGNTKGKLSKQVEKKAKDIFYLIDKDKSGEIDKQETMNFW